MTEHSPKISIGLPVYNGDKFIAQAIESILQQSFTDFELLISDNASTDATERMCRDFARLDLRVRYKRRDKNLGAAPNFNGLVSRARGEYFKWMAHDDMLRPQYLQQCLAMLEQNPQAVLSYPLAMDIDAEDKTLRRNVDAVKLDYAEAHKRLRYHICTNHSCLMVFGLIRRDILLQTNLIGSYVASDRVLLAELALRGPLVETPETLLLHREHDMRSTRAIPNLRERLQWFDTQKTQTVVSPHWKLLMEYVRAILAAPVRGLEQVRCFFQLVRWLRWFGAALIIEPFLFVISRLL